MVGRPHGARVDSPLPHGLVLETKVDHVGDSIAITTTVSADHEVITLGDDFFGCQTRLCLVDLSGQVIVDLPPALEGFL